MASKELIPKDDTLGTTETEPMLEGNGTSHGPHIAVNRPAYQLHQLADTYKLDENRAHTNREGVKAVIKRKCACSGACIKKSILGTLPFISIMRDYQWKKWIVSDIIAGLSVGVIHIPQGMGFALLTQLPAVYGLYASFWPVLFYFFFGTSRHISIGTMALISIMISSVISEQMAVAGLSDEPAAGAAVVENVTQVAGSNVTDVVQFKVGIAMSVTLIMGVVHVMMSFFKLGIIATFMSMPFVQSFMTGAAVNIITSQVPSLFQIKLPPSGTMFKTPITYIELFKNITQTNIACLVTGIICIMVLYVLKEIINDRYRSKLKVPIPAELIVVIIATIISHFCKFNNRWGVKIIGEIPRGIPVPAVPSMYNWQAYIVNAVVIAVVSFSISISMAKLMSQKHGYSIDTNQELLAYGLSYGLGSFFHAFAGAQAPPRTVVQDFTGGKTQLSSLVSCIMVLLVCLALGPLFKSLPNTVLAAVIIVALIPLLKSFRELPKLWKVSKYDFFTWFVTFCCTVFFDITVGLVFGVLFNVTTVVVQALMATAEVVAEVDNTGIYAQVQTPLAENRSVHGVTVFRFNSSLYFVNCESFKLKLFQHTKNPNAIQQEWNTEIHTIILDCSQISYIDMMGLNLIKQVHVDFKKIGVSVVLANCGSYVSNKLRVVDIIKDDGVGLIEVYPTLHDAVVSKKAI